MQLGELITELERVAGPNSVYADAPVEVITVSIDPQTSVDNNLEYDRHGGDVLQIKEVKYAPTFDRILIYVAPQD